MTRLLQLPWTIVFSRMRPRAGAIAGRAPAATAESR